MRVVKPEKCFTCGATESHVERRQVTLPVFGEDLTLEAEARVCDECGEKYFDPEYEGATLRRAYELYRERHVTVGAADVEALRKMYGISQRALGALLGWGEVTIHRYESGKPISKAHSDTLRDLFEPEQMRRAFERGKDRIPPAARRRLEERLVKYEAKEPSTIVSEAFQKAAAAEPPSEFTGYRSPSPEVLREMMVWFAARLGGVFKTKLNKLLYYADNLHFYWEAAPISAMPYVHLDHGPVPEWFDAHLELLELEEEAITRSEQAFGNEITGEVINASRDADTDVFPDTALPVLEAVAARFEKTTASEIRRISHEEEGYKNTRMRERISYEFAGDLRVEFDYNPSYGAEER